MPQASKRQKSRPSLDDDTELVRALYDVAGHARRFSSSDPVDTASVRLLYVLSSVGDARPSDVAVAVGLDLSTVSRHLRTLETRGLVARSSDPQDGRAQRVGVTAAGVAAIQQVIDNRVSTLAEVLDQWASDDRAELGRLLRRLADDLQSTHCTTPKDRA